MIVAYNLERDVVVPMLAASDDLMRHLSEHRHRGFYHVGYETPQAFDSMFRAEVDASSNECWRAPGT